MTKPFGDLVVVELAGSVAGGFAGKLFADHGATVLKVEPPGGDPLRAAGERWQGTGTLFAYLNTGKRSVMLDPGTPAGVERLRRLLAGADLAIESASPGPLRPLTDGLGHERLVSLYISPFGLTGPYAAYRSTAFTDYACAGQMYLNGEPDREPIQGAGRQPEYQAGAYGFIGAMAALWERERSGLGQTLDVSHMEGMASLHQWTTVRYTHGGVVQRRTGNRYDSTHPITIYPCKDGYVALSASRDDQLERFLAGAGLVHLIDDPRFATGVARLQHHAAFDAELLPWLLEHTVDEIVTMGQDLRVPVGPVPGLLALLDDPHLAARGFWQPLGDDPPLRYPGPPFRMSAHPWRLRPPPTLGADTERVAPEPERAAPAAGRREVGEVLPLAGVRVLDLSRVWAGPLATRILGDLGADVIRVEALSSRGRLVVPEAVVRQSARYPGNEAGARPWNREGMFNKFNRNKRAVTLQLETAAGKDVFERLVRVADVVIENYSPRVMPQLGLGYERLRALNPGTIYIGMPGFGWNGPNRDYVALGTMIEPAAGLSGLMGYPDSGPYKSGVAWADPVAALHAAAAVLIALWDRAADPEGRGQAIELAQIEAMIGFIGEEVLAAQVRGSDPPRRGNRAPDLVPQGCYPCAPGGLGGGAPDRRRLGNRPGSPIDESPGGGAPDRRARSAGDGGNRPGSPSEGGLGGGAPDRKGLGNRPGSPSQENDRWIAISVTDDGAWASLCALAGFDAAWASLPLCDRLARQDEIDAAIARWTRTQDQMALTHRLQAAGVAAFAVLDARQLVEDPHLTARGFFPLISHPDAGTYPFPGLPIHLSRTPARYRLPAPGLGEHNREVFAALLGMTAAEIEELEAQGVIGDRPPG